MSDDSRDSNELYIFLSIEFRTKFGGKGWMAQVWSMYLRSYFFFRKCNNARGMCKWRYSKKEEMKSFYSCVNNQYIFSKYLVNISTLYSDTSLFRTVREINSRKKIIVICRRKEIPLTLKSRKKRTTITENNGVIVAYTWPLRIA